VFRLFYSEKTMENELKPDARLLCAADFVRQGKTVADIGTDHGYLPVWLLVQGKVPFAYAADINRMPLDKARLNAAKYGVSKRVSLHLSDGLRFLDEGKADPAHPVDDIVICGMGGELIAKILALSAYSRKSGVRLILQPMTMADKLRLYLAENGYAVLDEKLVEAGGKLYTVLCTEYDGVARTLTPLEASLGQKNLEHGGALLEAYAKEWEKKLDTKIRGLATGGYDHKAEDSLLTEIRAILGKETL